MKKLLITKRIGHVIVMIAGEKIIMDTIGNVGVLDVNYTKRN